jgi:thiol-disulfide isomerase/thioredoxin
MKSKAFWLVAALAGALGAGFGFGAEDSRMRTPIPLPVEGQLASLDGATAWLSSPPLTAADLRGKVVVIDFWTYTCVNWLRTLPYVRAWAAKYGNRGLVVIGVHTPEFSVEHDVAGVRCAASEMRIDYPIAADNDYAIWRAFHNEYWPALYIADAQGRIRFQHFGEGEYERSERAIQQLLVEAGAKGLEDDLVSVDPRGSEVAADWGDVKSQENYVGYAKSEGFASRGGAARDQRHVYAAPAQLGLNHWALSGDWTVRQEPIVLHAAGGRIVYRFHARDLNLAMGPGEHGAPVRFRVRIDGRPPGAAHGSDVDAQGNGTVSGPRLYQLIRQPKPIADREFEIEFLDTGVEAFVFTFG